MIKYKRSPRIIKRIPREPITIKNAPTKNEMSKSSLAQIIITPLVMLMITIAISILMKRGLFVIMSISSTIISVIASISKFIHDKKETTEQNKLREKVYEEYLLDMRKKLFLAKESEEESYNYNYPSISQIEKMIHYRSSRIYERSAQDEDFLTFNMGYYKSDVSYKVNFTYNDLSLQKDPLEEEAKEIINNLTVIDRKPVIMDLKSAHIGLVGEKEVIHNQLKLIVSQLAFSQSYHDMQIVMLFDNKYENDFMWMRWFPHLKIQALNVYGIVNSERMRDQVLGSLHQILKERKQRVEESKKETRFLPHLVFIIDEPKWIADHSIMEYLNKEGDNLGFSIIYTSYMRANLPENIGTVIMLENSKEGTLLLENKEMRDLHFHLNQTENTDFDQMARNLSVFVHEQGVVSRIPESITFLDMYQVKKVNQLQIQSRWEKGETYKSLGVMLGVRAENDYLYLDLHERAHGPHGLVAGTTGSGKSEIIQSYILSLAVNFHPYEVGFLLIDYKGGGMAGLFRNLPHLLGTITNLDGSESMRAMASIKSELARRQRIFSENQVNHINDYNRLFKMGKVTEPIPHLFLISDEFAELKKEKSEFMTELVSAARIGRSLGIHLILATQKPSEVVDDQIWTNSRFKLALKVQNESDSKEIIKTPDAASITQPGRAYLQVGNNEIYELFQSAWSGAEYTEDNYGNTIDNRVYLINELGQGELVNGEITDKKGVSTIKITQLDAVVNEIKQIFDDMDIPKVRRPWLPPLARKICSPYVKDIHFENIENEDIPMDLTIPIGVTDVPEQQTQYEYKLNLMKDGNIVYFAASGYGKSVFLETVCLSLALKNSVDNVNFYICDFGNNALITLNALPHTSDYITADDTERLNKLMVLLQNEIKTRKKLFAQKMVQNFDVYNQLEEKPLKAIIVLVDNYDIVKEMGADIEEFFSKLGRDGQGLGIYLVISAGRLSGIRYTALNNFKNKIAGYLLEQSEAYSIVGKSSYKPQEMEGRALIKEEQVNNMQVYTMVEFKDEVEYNKNLKQLICDIEIMYPTKRAPRIPVLPENFTYNMLPNYQSSDASEIYFGLHKTTVELYGYKRLMSPFIIIGDASKGKTNMVKILASQACNKGKVYLFDSKDMSLYFMKDSQKMNYIQDEDDVADFVDDMKELQYQNKLAYEEAVKEGKNITPKDFYETLEPSYIIIDDMDDFTVKYQNNLTEMTELIKNASETGTGVIITINSSKAKKFDEFSTWSKSSSSGLVLGNIGTFLNYPTVLSKDMPVTGEGLLLLNGVYTKLLLPKFESNNL